MKTINIKGKEYVPVNERLKYFRENYKSYKLLSELVSNVNGVCVFKATVLNDKNEPVANGYSQEKEDDTRSVVNKTSYIENSETSAWGRALGNFGIGIDSSVASADEVANAIKQQEETKPKQFADQSVLEKIKKCESVFELEEIWNKLPETEKTVYKGKVKDRKEYLQSVEQKEKND